MSFLSGVKVLNQGKELVDAEEATKGKVIALYFSAMWCASCRQFTPKLKRFFAALKEEQVPFEIILVSRDREEEDLLEYFEEHNGDWLCLQFGDEKIQEFLARFEVQAIPSLRVIRPDGTIAVEDAKADIQSKGDEPLELFREWQAAVEKE